MGFDKADLGTDGNMDETITSVLTDLIAKQAHLDPSVIKPTSNLSELGVTSLDLLEIIMAVEDKYDVTIQVDAVEAWNNYKTVEDLIEMGRSLDLGRSSFAT